MTYEISIDNKAWLNPNDSIKLKFNKKIDQWSLRKISYLIAVVDTEEDVIDGNNKNLIVLVDKMINPQDSTELIIFKEGGFPALYASDKSTLLTEYTNYQLFLYIPNYKVDYLANNRIFYVYEEQ